MIRKVTLSYMLAVTVVQGALPALPAFVSTPAAAAAQAVAPVQVAVVLPVQAPAAAVRLSRAEMSEVQGAGFFSWITKALNFVKQILTILGAIKAIFDIFREKKETKGSDVEGGDTMERSENEYVDHASEEDYNAGRVSSVQTEVTSDWQQTYVWYGDQCSSTSEQDGGQFYMQQEISTCN